MKTLRLIIALLVVGIALGSNAQVTRRTDGETRKKDKKKALQPLPTGNSRSMR